MSTIHGCGASYSKARGYNEIDGQEFDADTIEDLVYALQMYSHIHLTYLDTDDGREEDLDLWLSKNE